MTDTTTTNLLNYAREHAAKSCQMFALDKGLTDTRPRWQESVTPDGSLLLSGRLVGQRPTWALSRFARDFYLTLKPGDMRPQFDVTQPGRTVLVWRFDGVWVELWHPDSVREVPQPVLSAPVAPEPARAVPTAPAAHATRRRSFLGPGGRLTFTRRKKETPAA